MSVTAQQTISLLENVLFESATLAEANAASWSGKADSVSGLAALMAASPEASIAAKVVGFYFASLGRAPSGAEVGYYVSQAEKGVSSSQIATGQVPQSTWNSISDFFVDSPEYAARAHLDYSLGQAAGLFEAVPWLYQTVLGRAPTGAEISFYDGQISSGADLATLFREFTASAEFHTDTSTIIANDLTQYGAAIASGGPTPPTVASPPPPAPPPAPASGPTQTVLTIGTDTISTADGTLVFTGTLGTGATLTANDSIHGNGNTLHITDTGHNQDVLPAGVSLSGIAAITLTTAGNAGSGILAAFDLSGDTGLTHFTLNASGGNGDYIKVGDGVAVAITSASGTVNVQTTGSATLTLTDGNMNNLTLGGNVALGSALSPFTLQASVAGTADNAGVDLSLQGSGHDSIRLGNGVDSLVLACHGVNGGSAPSVTDPNTLAGSGSSGGTAGFDTVFFGDGNDTVTLASIGGSGGNGGSITSSSLIFLAIGGSGAGGGPGGHESITLGNGNNTIVDDSAGGAGGSGGAAQSTDPASGGGAQSGPGGNGGDGGNNIITVGNGNNTITDNSTGGAAGLAGVATAANGSASQGVNGNPGTGGNDTIIVGTGNNTIDLVSHNNDTVNVGPDAAYGSAPGVPNDVIMNAASGDHIGFTSGGGLVGFSGTQVTLTGDATVADAIAHLEQQVGTAPGSLAWGTYSDGNTYLVETHGALSAANTVIVEIMGAHNIATGPFSFALLVS